MKGLKPVANRHTDALARVGWDHLETLLAAYYRSEGFEVEHVGTGATGARFDGGIDLKLRRGEQFIVVQCKHWNAMKVPHNAVHELLGLMVNHGATGAILANSGEFTKAATEAATKLGHVQLIDGNELRMMLGPIREPAPEFDVRMGAMDGAPAAVAKRIGERLLSATEDRIRHGSSGRGRRNATRSLAAVFAFKLLAGLLFLGFMLVMYQVFVHTIMSTLTPTAPRATVAPAAAGASTPASTQANPNVAETPPAPYESPAQTREEQREQQRRSEEAMKVIAESTPEL